MYHNVFLQVLHIWITHGNGWYYKNANDKTPSWTGVEFLYNFLIRNKSVGPFGKIAEIDELQIGDVIQLSFDGDTFGHSLLVIEKEGNDLDSIYVATHTFDTYGKRVSNYQYSNLRMIHIEGVRVW